MHIHLSRWAEDPNWENIYGVVMEKLVTLIVSAILISACASAPSNVPQDTLLADEGYLEMVNGNYERAEAILKVALSINDRNPYALLNLGVLYQNTNRLEEAQKMYRKLIEMNPDTLAVQSTEKKYEGKKLVDLAKDNLASLGISLK